MGREDGTDTVDSVGGSASSGSASSGMSDNFGMHDDSFGQQEYGGPNNLGGLNEDHMRASFNAVNQITDKNPYGKDGIFTRALGIDPSKIDYSNLMDLNTRSSIANNQFSKFANPTNTPGQLGYNPQFDPAPMGQLRSGVQKANYQTAYGPVMEQARKQGTGEMLARGAMGLAGGPIGMALAQLGTKEYGLPGVSGFDSFDPNNPRPGGGILGQFLGGLNPTQAKDALVGAFAPVAPAPKPTPIGTAPANTKGFEEKRSLHPLTGETGTKTFGDPLSDMYGYNMQASPEEISLVDGTTAGFLDTVAPTEAGQYNFNPAYDLSTQPSNPFGTSFDNIAPRGSLSPDELDSLIQNSTTQTASGGQLAGLFGENPKAAGFRDLEGMIRSVVDGENFPDDQNMYGPGMPNQTPLTPDELNNILEPYGMELGRGPSSGGIMQLAGGTDVTNMTQDERGMYRVEKDSNAIQRAFEALGLRPSKRGPSGQFYSPNKSRSFFDNPVGYVLGSQCKII